MAANLPFQLVTSNRKSDTVNQHAFTWRTFLPKFIQIRFETMEPENKKNKMNSSMRSVPDLKAVWVFHCCTEAVD